MTEFLNNTILFIKNATWLQQIEALFIVIGVPISLFKLFFPRLRIYFDVKETYHERVLVDVSGTPKSYWIHVMVKNRAFGESKKAMGYLQEVWIKNDKYVLLKDFNVALPLKWSHERLVEPKNILPKRTKRMDLGHIRDNDKRFFIETEHFPSGTARTLTPGNYLFVVIATADNTIFPHTEILKVGWDGIWKNLSCEYFVKNFRFYTKPVKSFKLYGKRIFK